jgi:TRAP-type mannitol/chloroaromatic compound transport system substrate-binding protein
MTDRRQFLRRAGLGAAGATLAAPAVRARNRIRWRLQTYAGEALADHVIRPAIETFNRVAHGEMEIELFAADQLVPTGELFAALRRGAVDAAQADDDSIGAPVDVATFSGYFPFATRSALDVPVLFNQYGLGSIWEEAYAELPGVVWLGAGAWDPCHIATRTPVRTLDDLRGKRLFTFPTAGQFLIRFGVIPVAVPWNDVRAALRDGRLDGVAWCGMTELRTVGWAAETPWYLTNPICGAWCGSHFANADRWRDLPFHLKELLRLALDSSNHHRMQWYWWGEAHYRASGDGPELTTIPADEWRRVEEKGAAFWREIATLSPRNARIVGILNQYRRTMDAAGPPYRQS